MNISKEVSVSVMTANLIATILVIAIHYSSKFAINTSLGYDWNYFIQEALTNGIARCAVPIFAVLAGYFISEKVNRLDKYAKILYNKVRTLFVPYFLASALIFLLTEVFPYACKPGAHPQLNLHTIMRDVVVHPCSPQFWFLRDLIILIIISPILFHAGKIISYGLGVTLSFLWGMDIQPFPIVAKWYLLNTETLFFFWLGGVLSKANINVDAIIFCKNKIKVMIMTSWLFLITLRIYIDPDLDVWYVNNYTMKALLLYKTAIIIGVICIFQLSAIIRKSRLLVYASGLTFFVYLFHLIPLAYFIYSISKVVKGPYSFYLDFPLAMFLSFLLAHITSRHFDRLFILFTGGRNPSKALQRIA